MCLKRTLPLAACWPHRFAVSRDESTKDLVKGLLRLNQKKRLSLDRVPWRCHWAVHCPFDLDKATAWSSWSHWFGAAKSYEVLKAEIRAISNTSIRWNMSYSLPTFVPQQLYIDQDLDATILCSDMDLLCCFTSQHGIQDRLHGLDPGMSGQRSPGRPPGAKVLSHPWFTVQNLRNRQLSGQVARRVLCLALRYFRSYMEHITPAQRR